MNDEAMDKGRREPASVMETSAARTDAPRAYTSVCEHQYIRVYTKSPMQGTRVQLYCRRCGQVKDASWRDIRR